MLITCPSGLVFQARSWKVGDRRHLHDRRILRSGLLMRKMLEAVDQGIENPGPYSFESGTKVDWAQVCLTDIIDALIGIRKVMRPLLSYKESCSNCGAKNEIDVDLREMKVEPLSPEGKAHLASGQPALVGLALVEEEDAPKVQARIRMLLGADMTHISKLMRQDPDTVSIAQLLLHIEAIVVSPDEEITSYDGIKRYYEDQDWIFHESLEEAINAFGGGTNTTVAMDCKRCNAEQEGALPFGGEFFYPQKSTRRSSLAIL